MAVGILCSAGGELAQEVDGGGARQRICDPYDGRCDFEIASSWLADSFEGNKQTRSSPAGWVRTCVGGYCFSGPVVSALAPHLIDGTCLAIEANCGPTGDISPFWVELPLKRIASNATAWSSSLSLVISKIRSLSKLTRETSFPLGPGSHLLCSRNLLCWSARLGEITQRVPLSPQRRCELDSFQSGHDW